MIASSALTAAALAYLSYVLAVPLLQQIKYDESVNDNNNNNNNNNVSAAGRCVVLVRISYYRLRISGIAAVG